MDIFLTTNDKTLELPFSIKLFLKSRIKITKIMMKLVKKISKYNLLTRQNESDV